MDFSHTVFVGMFAFMAAFAPATHADPDARYLDGSYADYRPGAGYYDSHGRSRHDDGVQLGARPFYLVEGMDEGNLKDRLKQCEDGPFYVSDFSIGHRGAALQFPEHTKESYEAAARMGAGIIECDVTFTRDGHLVCRHAECDLHTTTNPTCAKARPAPAGTTDSIPLARPSGRTATCTRRWTSLPARLASSASSATVTYHANCMGLK